MGPSANGSERCNPRVASSVRTGKGIVFTVPKASISVLRGKDRSAQEFRSTSLVTACRIGQESSPISGANNRLFYVWFSPIRRPEAEIEWASTVDENLLAMSRRWSRW